MDNSLELKAKMLFPNLKFMTKNDKELALSNDYKYTIIKEKSLFGITYEYNTKITRFDNHLKIKRYSFTITKGLPKPKSNYKKHNDSINEDYQKKHLKIVKNQILDLGYANLNDWEYFITLTFNDNELPNKKYSHENVIKCLSKWLNNLRFKNPNMKYLIVPEFHKSGRLHFHGLVANVPNWKLEKARYKNTNRLLKVNGKQIYNLKNYRLGFSTISFIEDKEKVINYISKYITKEMIDLKYKKRYWYSKNLNKPIYEYANLEKSINEYFNLNWYKNIIKENSNIELGSHWF